jgi:hypothetical protein
MTLDLLLVVDPPSIFWEVVGLERGPLSLVSILEELFERISSVFGLENWEYGRRDPSRWPRGTLYLRKLAVTSPTGGNDSVGIVRSRTKATEFRFFLVDTSFCGLVVKVLGYRSGGPGSIPGTTRKNKSSGSGTGSTQPREYNWGATW